MCITRSASLAVSIRKGFLLCWSPSSVFILSFKTITPNRVLSALHVTLRSRHYLLSLNHIIGSRKVRARYIYHAGEKKLALNFWTLSLFSLMLSGESLLSAPSFTRICASCQRLPDYKSILSSKGTHNSPSPYFDTKRENMCIKTSRGKNEKKRKNSNLY